MQDDANVYVSWNRLSGWWMWRIVGRMAPLFLSSAGLSNIGERADMLQASVIIVPFGELTDQSSFSSS